MSDNPEGTNDTSEGTKDTSETTKDSPEKNETGEKMETKDNSHFEDTYRLKSNENYEANKYEYKTDDKGRITECSGTLRLEEGKRNLDHQRKAGEEDRKETDDGGHLIACRFDGSGKVDNIVPMDKGLNRGEYKGMENHWAQELKDGNRVDVDIKVKYEGDSKRPEKINVREKVTEPDNSTRTKYYRFENGGE